MKQTGFTLIEMMITMAIIAVLASVATMSYTQYVLRANRADAKIALMQLAQRQERYFTENLRYAADFDELLENGNGATGNFDANDTDLWVDDSNGGYDAAVTDPKQDYKVTLTQPGGTATFKLTAEAVGTRQLKDTKCRTFTIDQTGNQAAKDKDGNNPNDDITKECWGR